MLQSPSLRISYTRSIPILQSPCNHPNLTLQINSSPLLPLPLRLNSQTTSRLSPFSPLLSPVVKMAVSTGLSFPHRHCSLCLSPPHFPPASLLSPRPFTRPTSTTLPLSDSTLDHTYRQTLPCHVVFPTAFHEAQQYESRATTREQRQGGMGASAEPFVNVPLASREHARPKRRHVINQQ